MAESVYKVIELVGTSTESWERAASAAVERASQSCATCGSPRSCSSTCSSRRRRVIAYRAKVNVSFKYEGGDTD